MKRIFFYVPFLFIALLFGCSEEISPDLSPKIVDGTVIDNPEKTPVILRSPGLKVVIENKGEVESLPCKTKLEFLSSDTEPIELQTPVIGPGMEHNLYFSVPFKTDKAKNYYRVTVDCQEEVQECNETNNQRYFSL